MYDFDDNAQPDLKYQTVAYVNGAAPPSALPAIMTLSTYAVNNYLSIRTIN
jgi:hypothetical protein